MALRLHRTLSLQTCDQVSHRSITGQLTSTECLSYLTVTKDGDKREIHAEPRPQAQSKKQNIQHLGTLLVIAVVGNGTDLIGIDWLLPSDFLICFESDNIWIVVTCFLQWGIWCDMTKSEINKLHSRKNEIFLHVWNLIRRFVQFLVLFDTFWFLLAKSWQICCVIPFRARKPAPSRGVTLKNTWTCNLLRDCVD